MDANEIKEIIRKAMDDLLMNNASCDYIVESKKSVQRLDNTRALDAYIKTVDIYLREGNVKCFMCPMGEKAEEPVLEVRNDKVTLNGIEIYHFSGKENSVREIIEESFGDNSSLNLEKLITDTFDNLRDDELSDPDIIVGVAERLLDEAEIGEYDAKISEKKDIELD